MTLVLVTSIIFIVLAGYWFAFKEGFFSGLLHLACVIVAGAIAFAFWEPLAHALLGSPSTKEWAWGASLLSLFCLALFLLRLGANLLVPERLNFPAIVDNIGGGLTGVATGVLTAGIGLIGIGFLPIGDTGGGFVRSQGNQAQPAQTSSINFAVLATTAFYETLSKGSFAPLTNRGNLATAYPMLARQAWGLHRDTFRDGRMELATDPGDITVSTPFQGFLPGSENELVIVPISVERGGFHKGTSFVLSASQAHLVGSGSNPATAFPDAWESGGRLYRFDDMSHYVTNKSGNQTVSMLLSFPAAQLKGQTPTSLFFKGVRLPLPAATDDFAMLRSGQSAPVAEYDKNAEEIPGSYLRADRRIGVVLNRNTLASGIKAQKDSITFSPGADIPSKAKGSVNKSLRVEFLYQLPGTKIVKLDASRGKSPVDIWGDIRQKAGTKAPLVLVDEKGSTYTPIGWLHTQASQGMINVKLDTRAGVEDVDQLPQLSTAGRDGLDVLFAIPIGTKIVAIKLGDETVGTADVTID